MSKQLSSFTCHSISQCLAGINLIYKYFGACVLNFLAGVYLLEILLSVRLCYTQFTWLKYESRGVIWSRIISAFFFIALSRRLFLKSKDRVVFGKIILKLLTRSWILTFSCPLFRLGVRRTLLVGGGSIIATIVYGVSFIDQIRKKFIYLSGFHPIAGAAATSVTSFSEKKKKKKITF